MKKPQLRSGPGEVPLRKSLLLLEDGAGLSTDSESRYTVSPSFQVRFLAQGRKLYLVLFGRQSGEGAGEGDADPTCRLDSKFSQNVIQPGKSGRG